MDERLKKLKKHLWAQISGKTSFGPLETSVVPLFLAGFKSSAGKGVCVIAPRSADAERFRTEYVLWRKLFCESDGSVEFLPDGTSGGHAIAESDAERARITEKASERFPEVLFAGVQALLSPCPAPDEVRNSVIRLKAGDTLDMNSLLKRLALMDYDDEVEVSVKNEFARRGGIIDVFSPGEELPARLDFFGDTLEAIRLFDPATQLTVKKVDEYKIIPRSGLQLSGTAGKSDFLSYVREAKPLVAVVHPDAVADELKRYGSEDDLTNWEKFISGKNVKIVKLLDETGAAADKTSSKFSIFPADGILENTLDGKAGEAFSFLAVQLCRNNVVRWMDEGYDVVLAGTSKSSCKRMKEWCGEAGLDETHTPEIVEKIFPCGIFAPGLKLAVLTEHELFRSTVSRYADKDKEKSSATKSDAEEAGSDDYFSEIEDGDYAVHVDLGICRYLGLKKIESGGGAISEMISLEFDDDAVINIPVREAHKISRYVGTKKDGVKLTRLNTTRWDKARAEAAKSVRDLAFGMLKLQSIRNSSDGVAFPQDSFQQTMFESAFPFRETEDQMRSLGEIKSDMESNRPMDRLLCGDVGFGKTELAMRAVCKCVLSGRQAAILVPTTVLAQQHYYSFMERFSSLPVTIDQLSRFRTKKEQEAIIAKLKSGALDVVIGTHRLIQKDVEFRDLGLIVIDEEQKFGVEHKEKLKRLRATVDVLTMTATPIPRTLYMSMSGLRDLSTIMSAPVRRMPVNTIVAQQDEGVIKNAVMRELQRGGQVYYLHNRVGTINKEADKLRALFPQARIEVAHGRMDERELEDTMSEFISGKVDVLVCTTIIESGLDIPNANTIIIDRADRLGLAELYQLRGRVGRWTRQAYAYMLLPKSNVMTGDARERISAIKHYTHLGSGFRLAMKDLEIRGSGNILGAEQSGQINAVGFDLYCKLLKECSALFRGEKVETVRETALFMDFLDYAVKASGGRMAAAFPESYVESPRLRLAAYRRLATRTTLESLKKFKGEIIDRFGALPEQAEALFTAAEIRLIAARGGASSVSYGDGAVYVEKNGSIVKPHGIIPKISVHLSNNQKLARMLRLMHELFG